MKARVRAVLITADGALLTIKRVRPGLAPYWVLPGGGVEPGDASLEDALRREIREELAGNATIHALLDVLETGGDRQYVYLARISRYDFGDRCGPEFAVRGRGEYLPHLVPLTLAGLAAITLVPSGVSDLLISCVSSGRDLFTLPDKRRARRRAITVGREAGETAKSREGSA